MVAVLLLQGAAPAQAHDPDHHHAGHRTDTGRRGLRYLSTVTNPDVPVCSGCELTGSFFASPAWVIEDGTSSTCISGAAHPWLELGWTEHGGFQDGSGNNKKRIYMYEAFVGDCDWVWEAGYLYGGDTIALRLEPTGTDAGCSSGTGECAWSYYKRINGGNWEYVRSVLAYMGDDGDPEQGTEVRVRTGDSHYAIAQPSSNGRVYFDGVWVRRSDGSWYTWTSSEVSTTSIYENHADYGASYSNQYYNWNSYGP